MLQCPSCTRRTLRERNGGHLVCDNCYKQYVVNQRNELEEVVMPDYHFHPSPFPTHESKQLNVHLQQMAQEMRPGDPRHDFCLALGTALRDGFYTLNQQRGRT